MKRISLVAFATVILSATVPAQAQVMSQAIAYKAGSVVVTQPWARATPTSAPVAGGYVTITNTGTEPDRLIGGTTDIAAKLEVHEMSMANGTMTMRPVDGGLEVKPGATVELKPGGYHIMFEQLKHGLTEGDHFKAQLEFAKGGKVDVEFSVRGIGATGPMMEMQHQH
jgi:copper(I)-binding protein